MNLVGHSALRRTIRRAGPLFAARWLSKQEAAFRALSQSRARPGSPVCRWARAAGAPRGTSQRAVRGRSDLALMGFSVFAPECRYLAWSPGLPVSGEAVCKSPPHR